MEEALRLSQKQKLHQSLSPLQVQFVKVLEMNAPEIEEEVNRALDENPALEVSSDAVPVTGTDADGDFTESSEQLQLADYRHEDDIPAYRFEANNRSAGSSRFEPLAVEGGGSLMEQLMSQLYQMPLNEKELKIARIITGNLDDNGYMTRTLLSIADDAAINEGIDTDPAEVKKAEFPSPEIW